MRTRVVGQIQSQGYATVGTYDSAICCEQIITSLSGVIEDEKW